MQVAEDVAALTRDSVPVGQSKQEVCATWSVYAPGGQAVQEVADFQLTLPGLYVPLAQAVGHGTLSPVTVE